MWRSPLLVAMAIGVTLGAGGCTRLEEGDGSGADGSTGGSSDGGGGTAPGSDSGTGGSSSSGGGSGGSGGPDGSPGTSRDSSTGGVDSGRSGSSEASSPPMRGPEPPSNGTNFPFPQNRQASRCTYPTAYRNEDVQAAYAQWKADTVTTSGAGNFRRVQRTPSDQGLAMGSTVSEGIGYGMLIAVYMGDQSLFDDLWQYEQLHLGQCPPNGACPAMQLMDWNILADGTTAMGGTGAATDADEDMAFALAMADRQWGGQGKLPRTYHQFAVDQITAIWVLEVFQSMLMKPGTWGDNNTVNISYFAPAYYRVFKAVGGNLPKPDGGNWNPNWDATIDGSYTTINNSLNAASGNQNNGLVPAWCTSAGVPNPNALSPNGNATNYQYDSCRTPFRIALDWCWNGETRAQAYVAKTSAFFSGIGAGNIADGYALDGAAQAQHAGALSAAFIGPAGVGAMSSSSYQSFLDGAYGEVATHNLLAGGAYYEDSWTVMSLLMMTANFLDYTMY